MYSQSQVQNNPTAAYVVSLIGGILGLIGGLFAVFAGAVVGVFSLGLGFAFIGGLGLWITVCSIIVIYAATRLNAEPLEHTKWGVIILVFSIIGSWSILNLIGGILALVYTPVIANQNQYAQQQPYYGPPTQQTSYSSQQQWGQQQQPLTRMCPTCGKTVQSDVRFCPSCGTKFY